ncbi:hypothetical protein F5148DRAFT_1296709 [Russula earlei]|uniref:Uncharacterized protein n=1 Tax=Russula earlei TaxID=71964 RepID=A0ACC0TQJ2_9AGAM|nr:hypothetical protein F5148DRAFT_1296709 [Russula earlei]
MKQLLFIVALLWGIQGFSQVQQVNLTASGLTCSMCSKAIYKALTALPFVQQVQPDIQHSSYAITFREHTQPDFDAIANAVTGAGFSVAKLQATINFTGEQVQNDTHLKVNNETFHFLHVSDRKLNGATTVTLVDRNFVTAKEYKKYSQYTTMKCYTTGMMESCCSKKEAQELYVFTEPASNMPAHSLSVKQTMKVLHDASSEAINQRQSTELMFGLNKDWMVHASTTFSNMYSHAFQWESVRMYTKYRFLTRDDLYSHFRMAAFAEASYSRNVPHYDELSLEGDHKGVQAGVIATQLLHKLALSSSVSLIENFQEGRGEKSVYSAQSYEGLNYSVSAGYLLFPRQYTNYNQINVNLYAELLGQKSLDLNRSYLDVAPAIQFIFNSQAKLNAGYRFQVNGNMYRMSNNSWLLSFEWLWLNALKKK